MINLSPTLKTLKIIERVCTLSVLVYILLNYSNISDTIPIHFNIGGKANSNGSKVVIFVLLGIMTFFSFMMGLLNKYPHLFNYPIEITDKNREYCYQVAQKFIAWMSLHTTLCFSFLTINMVLIGLDYMDSLSILFLPLMIGGISLIIFYFIRKLTNA